MTTCGKKATEEYLATVEDIDFQFARDKENLISSFRVAGARGDQIRELVQEGMELPEELLNQTLVGGKQGALTSIFNSIGARLLSSDSFAARGLASRLLEAAQGGSAVKTTAASNVLIFKREFLGEVGGRHHEGLKDYIAEQGIRKINMFNPRVLEEFSEKVFLEIRKPGSFESDAVKLAAEGYRNSFQSMLEKAKQYDVHGFKDLKVDRNYAPVISSPQRVMQAISEAELRLGRNNGLKAVEQVLTDAYVSGKFNLSEKSARLVAKGVIARASSSERTMATAFRGIKNSDIEAMAEELRKAGLSDEAIESFTASTREHELKAQISDRAKLSFGADLSVEHKGIKASDLFETNIERLHKQYTDEMSANVAIAEKGFKTRGQLESTIDDLATHMINDLNLDAGKVKTDIDMFRAAVRILYNQPIEEGMSRTVTRYGGLLRALTSFMRLNMHGLASFPESARVLAARGANISFRNIPSLKELALSSRAFREEGKYFGAYKNPEYEETDQIFRYLGDDYILDYRGIAVDSIEEASTSKWTRLIESSISSGQHVQNFTSFFRAIQGGGEKLAGRSLVHAIKKEVTGDLDRALSDVEIREAGWHDGFYDKFREWGKDNIKEIEWEGKVLKVFDWDKLPPEDFHRLRTGFYRIIKRQMQAQAAGETSLWMNTFFGKFLSQFRAFPLASLEKQLIRDVKFDKAGGSVVFAASAAMALGMHMAQAQARSVGRGDRKEYLEDAFSPLGLTLGTFNRMGQLASIGLMADGLATFSLVPDAVMASGTSYGVRGISPSTIPAIGAVTDISKAAGAIPSMIKGNITPDQALNRFQKVIVPAQILGIHNAWNALEHELEE